MCVNEPRTGGTRSARRAQRPIATPTEQTTAANQLARVATSDRLGPFAAAKVRASAIGFCYRSAGGTCKPALVFHNTCGAVAVSPSGTWAARTAPILPQAGETARDACQAASHQDCAVKAVYCSPEE
jgi:hypothetical protein